MSGDIFRNGNIWNGEFFGSRIKLVQFCFSEL